MNILIPDSWLRDYLKTDATPKELKDCLSLCGPSVERINVVDGETVYDIEVTGNRPDMMCVSGIAREASVILPRFGIDAKMVNDPYALKEKSMKSKGKDTLAITTDSEVNPRFSAIVLSGITKKPTPLWMQKWLTLAGMRPISAIVDITNYLMKAFGQPVHAFDFDQILPNKKGEPTMTLRLSKKGEKIMTLDGKTHTLPGDDIVIADGSGRLIDLCGIMGGGVSHIKESSNKIVLFVQTYDPMHIRRTSMKLAHRTEAAGLFEKGIDAELVMPTMQKGIELVKDLTGGIPTSTLYDIYPAPYKAPQVSASKDKIITYIGSNLTDGEMKKILVPLGFETTITKEEVTVTVPSFRRDVTRDVDVIEEIARIYGYHTITNRLPDTEPPQMYEDPILGDELKVKHLLRDWGYTEIMPYSMISDELLTLFGFDKEKTYTIVNPLSSEWIYMRPSLVPTLLVTLKNNLQMTGDLALFELSMVYEYQKNTLPDEHPRLIVARPGHQFQTLKGVGERLFELFGIALPHDDGLIPKWVDINNSLTFGTYGIVGEVNREYLTALGICEPVTILDLDFRALSCAKHPTHRFQPIPLYPPSFEDLAVIVPERTFIGPIMEDIRNVSTLITDVSLLDEYKNAKTFHITYQSKTKNLTSEDIQPIREKILSMLDKKYQAALKTA